MSLPEQVAELAPTHPVLARFATLLGSAGVTAMAENADAGIRALTGNPGQRPHELRTLLRNTAAAATTPMQSIDLPRGDAA